MNYYEDHKKNVEKELLELIEKGAQWEDNIKNDVNGSDIDIIWVASDLLKQGKIKIEDALRIAKYFEFVEEENENAKKYAQKLDTEIRDEKDVRVIATTKGTLCWLLQDIVVQNINAGSNGMKTAYFSKVLEILQSIISDKNLYFRQEAVFPLSVLVANMNATQFKNGGKFDFGSENKEKTKTLLFDTMLHDPENKKNKRMLERIAYVFNPIRIIDQDKALDMLKTLVYDTEEKLNPDYVIRETLRPLIFFSEFYEGDNNAFRPLLADVIKKSSGSVKSSIVWHFWKVCEEKSEYYDRLKKYIDLFFESPFLPEIINQMDLFVELLMKVLPKEGILLLEKELNYIKNGFDPSNNKQNRVWLLSSDIILKEILERNPEKFNECLRKYCELSQIGIYIGEPQSFLRLVNLVPEKDKAEAKKILEPIYKMVTEWAKAQNKPELLDGIKW